MKNSEIRFYVQLDEKKMPEKIEWEATDADFSGRKESKTLLLSLWDKEENLTMGIDLWTKEMLVNDMNVHYHQTFLKMADTFFKATQNNEVSNMIRNFANDFAEKLNILDSKSPN